ncbi:iron chelate uptake ABC transporter family permease subunit [Granulicatella seriolae]|uniref:Iron chelate uptake ABC transporter family permease subunit n=1 Tax=Granulicatella seriolae TaxID=2967226 RepID=A0ABT1WNM6_9LACT|nr:iron chelate uptake ABC transporter family permease subunit [Granulicatella seriolae]
MQKKSSQIILGSSLVCLLAMSIAAYYFLDNRPLTDYVIAVRNQKMLAYILVSMASVLATITFQTVINNRFLTPSVLGLESLYVFLQTVYLFFFWQHLEKVGRNPLVEFLLVLGVQVCLFLVFQSLLSKLLKIDFTVLLLMAMALGTLFRSLSTFLQVLMDPNEYDKLMTRLFPTFQKFNSAILWLAIVIVMFCAIYLLSKRYLLDVLLLGDQSAITLGVDVFKVRNRMLLITVLLTATVTALVGPMMFFGFLIVNLTYRLVKDYRHHILFLYGTLIGSILLICGQVLIERVFQFDINISMVIELFGGLLFFYLLWKERVKQ